MGNTHICYHRIPALSTAILASIAYIFVLVAGTTCDFIDVSAKPGQFLEYTTQDGIIVDMFGAKLGVLCETPPLLLREGDSLWNMSFYFWIAASVVGGFGVTLSWALTTFLGPTDWNWKILSFLSGVSAIIQAPVFLLFESKPCVENDCTVSTGCVMLMISTIFWVTLTLLTQCQDPPMWANELNNWRVQKEREEGVVRPTRESRWTRLMRRKKWASTLGLAATESGSVNEISRLELIENGSYYADSNNSRLMLKVMPDGKILGDDQKSVTTFGDLEDMVNYADEERQFAPMLGREKEYSEDAEDPSLLFREGFTRGGPKEILIIHSHLDAPAEEEKTEEKALLEDEEVPLRSCMPQERQIRITGIRALTKRIRLESKRNKSKSGYAQLDEEGGSDADIEDEINDRREYCPPRSPPLSPFQLNEFSQQEIPSPLTVEHPRSQELLHDWDALHAAAYAGIMLPTTISIADCKEDEPEPVYCSSEETGSVMSLTSFGDFPDDEELEDGMSGSTLSSDSSNDEDPSKSRRERKSRRRRTFSTANSVASRTSLLELTIAEETDGDLQELGSSGDEKMKLSQDYALRGVKSAPDRLSFERAVTSYSPNQSDTYPLLHGDLDCVSEDTDGSRVSEVLRKAADMRRITPVVENSEEGTDLNSIIDTGPSITSPERKNNSPRRGRCMSVPRRNRSSVHPISPVQRGSSVAARFRDERVEKAGIHSPHINVVSDESSDGNESFTARSFRSAVSRRARNARVKRMHDDVERRRARTLDPPQRRRRPKPEVVIFDPTLRAIFVNRQAGVEYGPDEASL